MWLDILLVLLIAAALLSAILKLVRDRRRGKGCGCGCGGCPTANICHADKSDRKGRA